MCANTQVRATNTARLSQDERNAVTPAASPRLRREGQPKAGRMSASSYQPSLLYPLSVLLVGLAMSWLVRNPSSEVMKRLPPRSALPRPVLATSHNDEMQAYPLVR